MRGVAPPGRPLPAALCRRPRPRSGRALVGAGRPHPGPVRRGLRAGKPPGPLARLSQPLQRHERRSAWRRSSTHLRKGLAAAAERSDPRICLLTPGPFSETYFEQAHLARYLGFLLVEGDDLVVRDGRVYVRTIAGLKRADVILRAGRRRLRRSAGAQRRVAARRRRACSRRSASGGVAVLNMPGSGVLESKALLGFLPEALPPAARRGAEDAAMSPPGGAASPPSGRWWRASSTTWLSRRPSTAPGRTASRRRPRLMADLTTGPSATSSWPASTTGRATSSARRWCGCRRRRSCATAGWSRRRSCCASTPPPRRTACAVMPGGFCRTSDRSGRAGHLHGRGRPHRRRVGHRRQAGGARQPAGQPRRRQGSAHPGSSAQPRRRQPVLAGPLPGARAKPPCGWCAACARA